MKHSPEILKELADLSPVVAQFPKGNIFKVPENYFLNFSEILLSKIEESGSLPAKEIITQKVPEGYFENLTESILNKVKDIPAETAKEEMYILSPVIAGIGNKNIFRVPEGYFENFSDQKQITIEPAKVVTVNFRKRLLQYAAAAVATFLIGLALFNYNNKADLQIENNLAQAKQTEAVMAKAQKIINENSFDELLNELPEVEIENYLEQKGVDVQAALIASSIDAKNLPTAEDYLFNEDALSDFLKEQNIPN